MPLRHPLPQGQAVIEHSACREPAIVGDWADKEARQAWTFTKAGPKDYTVTFMDGDGKKGVFVGEIAASYRAHGYTFDPAMSISDGSIVGNRKRWVYNVGRDGFLYKIDLVTLKALARVRVGIDARAIAVSDDGKHVIVPLAFAAQLRLEELAPHHPLYGRVTAAER